MITIKYNYDKDKITSGIVHIGVGNFHRAHQAFYTNQLLAFPDQNTWGICGASLLASDKNTVDRLRQQQFDYTLTVCGRYGNDTVHKIGALKEIVAGYEFPEAVIAKMGSPSTKIISLTITEGGYNIDKNTGAFDLQQEAIQHDLKNKHTPTTVFGFVAEGLRARRMYGSGGVTILSCDNLQHNGDTAKKAFTTFIAAQDPALAEWVAHNVTFPNSMVDRITPATTKQDLIRLNINSGIDDLAPVYSEDFIQWVIEDNFIAGRPAWERVGVEFTEDVTAYENMKLSLLNASHTLLSYPAFLKGHRAVDVAMQDTSIVQLLRDFMNLDVTPFVEIPKGIDLEVYKQTLLERFANKAVSDQVSRLCADGISKFPVYIVPVATKMLQTNKEMKRIAFLLAVYRHYLKYQQDDQGTRYTLTEPWLTKQEVQLIDSDDAAEFLKISPFVSVNWNSSASFLEQYLNFVEEVKVQGVAPTLDSLLQPAEATCSTN
ncbi:mannitol dehydrogenase family protein [Flavobacterium tegetincola]|uniref:mannitol dehydrogenase family protein n=1 Tax=Flavobacterium tegetincola TaxID=150172 RepID=UPI000426F876|nr:mannitol dehydrogenase family protein [Flavobacterium tegetincola]